MMGSILLGVGGAASAIAMSLVGGSVRGQEFGGLLCPAYADAAMVTAEGAMFGVSVEDAISMAEKSVSDEDVRLVLKVVIDFVYREDMTPSEAHDVVLDACMQDRW